MGTHQLALPLPHEYAPNSRHGCAFFQTDCSCDDTPPSYAPLDRYLDDLCAFLMSARLIQNHPENFWSYVDGSDAWMSVPSHIDLDGVRQSDVDHVMQLCGAVGELIDANSIATVSSIIADGPVMHRPMRTPSRTASRERGTTCCPSSAQTPNDAATAAETTDTVHTCPADRRGDRNLEHACPTELPTTRRGSGAVLHDEVDPRARRGPGAEEMVWSALQRFYECTKQLQLGRRRRPRNDSARCTLGLVGVNQAHCSSGSSTNNRDANSSHRTDSIHAENKTTSNSSHIMGNSNNSDITSSNNNRNARMDTDRRDAWECDEENRNLRGTAERIVTDSNSHHAVDSNTGGTDQTSSCRTDDEADCVGTMPDDAAEDASPRRPPVPRETVDRVLGMVLSHGMSAKKKHEVTVMRATVADLVDCCNAPCGCTCGSRANDTARAAGSDRAEMEEETERTAQTPAPLRVSPPSSSSSSSLSSRCACGCRRGVTPPFLSCRVRRSDGSAAMTDTVINIGEGKGYVSRALAFCDGLQVIGLDCNPAHRGRAVERVECLLESSVSAARGGRAKRCDTRGWSGATEMVNLHYTRRGYLCSIACRVHEHMDWKALLQPHVQTVDCPNAPPPAQPHTARLVAPTRPSDVPSRFDTNRVSRARSPRPGTPTRAADVDRGAGGAMDPTRHLLHRTWEDGGGGGGVRDAVGHDRGGGNTGTPPPPPPPRDGLERKRRCRVCASLLRASNRLSMLRHIQLHMRQRPCEDGEEAAPVHGARGTMTMMMEEEEEEEKEKPPCAGLDARRGVACARGRRAVGAVHLSQATLTRWRNTLPQEEYITQLIQSYFGADDERGGVDADGRDGLSGTDGEAGQVGPEEEHRRCDARRAWDETTCGGRRWLRSVLVERGRRATVWCPVDAVTCATTAQTALPVDATRRWSAGAGSGVSHRSGRDGEDGGGYDARNECAETDDRPACPAMGSRGSMPCSTRGVRRRLTVVGYDSSAGRHRVVFDGGTRTESYILYSCVDSSLAQSLLRCDAMPQLDEPTPTSTPYTALSGDWAEHCRRSGRVALVLQVHPVVTPYRPAVCVPSLRNCILIGLHACGNLGADVCRLFTSCSAKGLLLVSCCWHALTPTAFPLSAALQKRRITLNHLSLQLATQPLDMWTAVCHDGHRASAKMLFFRTVLKMWWGSLSASYRRDRRAGGQTQPDRMTRRVSARVGGACDAVGTTDTDGASAGGGCCVFCPTPQLEPAFLRRMARVKHTITFAQFAAQVCEEYIYSATARTTAYTWQKTVCASCRVVQERVIRNAVQDGSAQRFGDRLFRDHFATFVGFTVLRMWMCHIPETVLLLDRVLYLHEVLIRHGRLAGEGDGSAVSLVPLFDGALSPRMYGILARRC